MNLSKIGLIFFSLISFPLFADGQLGDVVYSYLKKGDFLSIHGPGWELISSGDYINDSDLCKKFRICTLPEAEGAFFRVKGGKSGEIGIIQNYATARPQNAFRGDSDAIPDHHHGKTTDIIEHGGSSGGLDGGGYRFARPIPTQMSGGHQHKVEINAGGDSETRPTNIALYAYIKINEMKTGERGSVFEENVKRLEKGVEVALKRKICPIQTEELSPKSVDEIFNCHKNLIEAYEGVSGIQYRLSEQELKNSLYILRLLAKNYSINKDSSNYINKIIKKYPLF